MKSQYLNDEKKFRVAKVSSALIVGAGHGIGLALVERLRTRASNVQISATYHKPDNAEGLLKLARKSENVVTQRFDPLAEDAFDKLSTALVAHAPFDLVINAIGILHEEGVGPERSLDAISLTQMQKVFSVNAFVTPLLARFAKPHLARDQSTAFVALSAKVGSIGDNQLGGWYSYRASKAALNMFIKTIALEFSHSGLSRCSVLAIHPGTTDTALLGRTSETLSIRSGRPRNRRITFSTRLNPPARKERDYLRIGMERLCPGR